MKDKIFKAIKCVLFMLPFVFVAGKTLYTILNENAKDSYSDNQNLTTINSADLSITERYYVSSELLSFSRSYGNSILYVNNYVDNTNLLDSSQQNRVYKITFYVNSEFIPRVYFYDINNVGIKYVNLNSSTLNFNFEFINITYDNNSQSIDNYITFYTINNYKSLDNAFVYSLSEFNNIGFGKIDFLEWFNDLFLNNNFNNVYSIFINSYLNYFLFVELVMFIPSVFHWVIHFFTEIGNNALSRSTKKEKGDD